MYGPHTNEQLVGELLMVEPFIHAHRLILAEEVEQHQAIDVQGKLSQASERNMTSQPSLALFMAPQ